MTLYDEMVNHILI